MKMEKEDIDFKFWKMLLALKIGAKILIDVENEQFKNNPIEYK